MTQSKIIDFQGTKVELRQIDNGDWVDERGTVYPEWLFDEGFCGLSPFETGKLDPFWKKACLPHDQAFNRMKNGYDDSSVKNAEVFSNFAKEVGIVMAQSAFGLVAGVPYILFGGLGGLARWALLSRRNK